jgi:hypothetical protein
MNSTQALPRVMVSENRRFIVTEHGEPFFWLGDTAWELFHRLTRDEAAFYFDNRAERRFNVIQAVALAEVDGLNTPNRYGHCPLIDNDPTRPNEDYFALVDEFIRMAGERGLYMGLLPTWGDKVLPLWGIGPAIFNPENAYVYGRWLGERYRAQTNVIWILGGDRPPSHEDQDFRPVWREMARGIREGVRAPLLMTYHPAGGHSTGEWLHDEDWLDMNMMQSGHGGGHDVPVWEAVERDFLREPVKPTLDGEPNYEDHPVSPWPEWDPANGYFRDEDVRKQIYRSVFAGACGVTYGHHSVWQFYEEGRVPVTFPERDWRNAILRPGAAQVNHLRVLMESRPYGSRIPDQSLLVSASGERGEHVQATRDERGRYAFVYLPMNRPVTIHLSKLGGEQVRAQWYDPRTGQWQAAGIVPVVEAHVFNPPPGGPDWVLVLDRL